MKISKKIIELSLVFGATLTRLSFFSPFKEFQGIRSCGSDGSKEVSTHGIPFQYLDYKDSVTDEGCSNPISPATDCFTWKNKNLVVGKLSYSSQGFRPIPFLADLITWSLASSLLLSTIPRMRE